MKNLNIIVSIFLSIATFVPSFAQEGGDLEGLYTEKTSQFEDGKGLITLDTFVTGEVQVVQGSATPCDIVLVIDFSESMKSRLADLKASCKAFLQTIREAETDGVEHRVAIVSYATYQEMSIGGANVDCTVVWPQVAGSGTLEDLDPYGNRSSDNDNTHQRNSDATVSNYVRNELKSFFIPVDETIDGKGNILDFIVDHFQESDMGKMPDLKWGTDGNSFRGLQVAGELLEGRPNTEGGKKYRNSDGDLVDKPIFVVLFTDGVPGFESSSFTFSDENLSICYALNAIGEANKLKKNDAVLFSVGLNSVCNSAFDLDLGGYASSGSMMNSSYYFSKPENAFNVYLNLISSNYKGNFTDLYLRSDIVKGEQTGWGPNAHSYSDFIDERFVIWNSRKTSLSSYFSFETPHYFTGTDSDGLRKALEKISEMITTVIVPVPLGTETVIKDFIDNTTFKLPDNATEGDIKVYTRAIKSITDTGTDKKYEFYPAPDPVPDTYPEGVTVSLSEKDSQGNQGVTITGFDFKANYVGYDENEKLHGCELEVLIPFEFQDDFEHTDGTYQTNSPESGIYDENGENIQPYPVPSIMIRDINITRKNLETGESVVYDVYKVGKTFEYKKDDLRYRVVLTGVSDDGSEDVSCTITGATAYEEGDYVYWLVQEAGWSWAYDLINMDGDPRAKVQSFQDSQLKFVFEGPHKPSDPKNKVAPINKLFHAEVNKQQTVPHPDRTNN